MRDATAILIPASMIADCNLSYGPFRVLLYLAHQVPRVPVPQFAGLRGQVPRVPRSSYTLSTDEASLTQSVPLAAMPDY
jgi:hypothetical protein